MSLLRADEILFDGRHSQTIVEVFADRGIHPSNDSLKDVSRDLFCQQGQ